MEARCLIGFVCPALFQALSATLTYDERLKNGSEVFLQFALLYSTTDGHRRIRHGFGAVLQCRTPCQHAQAMPA